MDSIDQRVSDCMSSNWDNIFQAIKNPLVGSGLLGRPVDLHLGLDNRASYHQQKDKGMQAKGNFHYDGYW